MQRTFQNTVRVWPYAINLYTIQNNDLLLRLASVPTKHILNVSCSSHQEAPLTLVKNKAILDMNQITR